MDIAAEVVKLDARVAEINSELESLQQEHDVHAAAKAEAERRMAEVVARRIVLRKEREGLSKLRESAAVKQRIVTAEEAANKSKADADAMLARLAEKEKRLDEMLASLKPSEAAVSTEIQSGA